MEKDSGHALSELAVDGGMSNSDLSMQVQKLSSYPSPTFKRMRQPMLTALLSINVQIQADLISIPVYRPKMRETTALGAAIAAGLAVGLWRNFAELRDINRAGGTVFRPQMSVDQSCEQFKLWEKAVGMCKGWVGDKAHSKDQDSPKQTNGHTVDLSNGGSGVVDTASPTKTIPPMNTNGEMVLSKAPWINISGDLGDADDQDLFLELRKLEILQRLKRLGKIKVTYL